MRIRSWLVELVPFAAMVSVECLDVGLTTLSKAAMSNEPLCLCCLLKCFGIRHFPPFCFLPHQWNIGGLLIATVCRIQQATSVSSSYLLSYQATILKGYSSKITLLSFYCLFGFVQCTMVTLIPERNNLDAWKLSLEIEFISIICFLDISHVSSWSQEGRAFVSVSRVACPSQEEHQSKTSIESSCNTVSNGVLAWCIRRKGPVFVAMFQPIGVAIAAFFGCVFLGDTYIIGAVIIFIGFYGAIWARSKEEKEVTSIDKPQVSSSETPLLNAHAHP
ncbi:hypothetical protein QQP08_010350 [Theobroma cacao]|nr:hypothetical protein QQP08_010350 [Theobroma cacao]